MSGPAALAVALAGGRRGQIVEGGDITEACEVNGLWRGRLLCTQDGGHDAVERAEIDGADNLGVAIDASALTCVIVGVPLDVFRGMFDGIQREAEQSSERIAAV